MVPVPKLRFPMNLAELEEVLRRIEKLEKQATRIRTTVHDDKLIFSGEKMIGTTTRSLGGGGPEIRTGYYKDKRGGGLVGGIRKTVKINPAIILDLDDVKVSEKEIQDKLQLLTDERQVGYLPPLKLMQIGASPNYEVVEDYPYDVDYFAIKRQPNFSKLKGASKGVPHLATITARTGFQFDRASIPRIFWAIISKDDLSAVPPLFHDLLYRFAGKLPKKDVAPETIFTREEADNLFLHLMKQSGVKEWRAWAAYQAVKKFGKSSWGAK
jgi:hypothetical protein